MRRITISDIRSRVDYLNRYLTRLGAPNRLTVSWTYGQPRVYLSKAETPDVEDRPLSMRLPTGQLMSWLEGVTDGLTLVEVPNKE